MKSIFLSQQSKPLLPFTIIFATKVDVRRISPAVGEFAFQCSQPRHIMSSFIIEFIELNDPGVFYKDGEFLVTPHRCGGIVVIYMSLLLHYEKHILR